MRKITLVCSAHRENGLCNAEELLKILRAIEPDVIFEEVRPSDFAAHCKRGASLEAQAIAKYRKLRLFERVPVDRHDMPANLYPETQSVLDRVEQMSQQYLALQDQRANSANRYGFRYLNSVVFETITARISEIEEKTISGTGGQGLIDRLDKWRLALHMRDVEMVGNIYQFCREKVFDAGVFLVGATHKTGIVKEIQEHARKEPDLIYWNFAYDDPIP